MEETKSTDEDDLFFDASDEFPFYDCPNSFHNSTSTLSFSSSQNPNFPNSALRRPRFRDKNPNFASDKVATTSESAIETENLEIIEENSPSLRVNNDEQFNFLVYLAELIVKAIGFQFNLLISLFTFPFWVLYYCILFAVNPFHVFSLGKSYLIGEVMKFGNFVVSTFSPLLSEWLKENNSVLKLVLRCGLGLFWSVYVCSILVALLISSFVISGLIMKYILVEQPFQLKQGLNFDYTENKPVAFVPISVCHAVEHGEKNGVVNGGYVRVIPPNHKLQATVTLVLPESDYNRKLGIFQIRVDFLSENGKSLTSLRQISMLNFRSEPIRLLLTCFKVVPLIAGCLSESQTLNLKFRGYSEGAIPTACVKVTIEQRAEFRPGAGVPELYNAFLHLESELPFLKRCVWHWRRTIFVWFSMMLFLVELLFAMVCCRPLILPRARTRVNAPTSSGSQATSQVQNSS